MRGEVLGIDWGLARVGIARAMGGIATPEKVIRRVSFKGVVDEVVRLVGRWEVELVVVGKSGSGMGEEIAGLMEELRVRTRIPVVAWDETMSSREAEEKAIEMGMGRKKRRKLGDALAATVMLQSFLDREERDDV